MNIPKIIGICGRKRSGKDTIAQYLCQQYGYENQKISEDLKKMVQLLFGFSDEQVEDDTKDVNDTRWDISPREAMQFFGTHVMQKEIQHLLTKKQIGRRFWIESFVTKHNLHDTEKRIVISDIRFLHEYEVLKRYNAFIIRVDKDAMPFDQSDHESEKDYINIPTDAILKNNGNVIDLYNNIEDMISQISLHVGK